MRPEPGTYPSYFGNYIQLVEQSTVIEALLENERQTLAFFNSIDEQTGNHRYAENKWSIKEILNHINDAERIFSYRALCFARRDPQLLPSFDENTYVANSGASLRLLKDHIDEFAAIRKATIALYNSFNTDDLLHSGQTPVGKSTPLALGFIICGHPIHHMNVIKERYLR